MSLLQVGSTGEEVRLLQKALSELTGVRLSYDGHFGEVTRKSLIQYQQSSGLKLTGVYDEATMNQLEPFISNKYIRTNDIDAYADKIKVDRNILKALAIKEAKASGFTPTGRCLILYERHIFYRYAVRKFGQAKVSEWSKKNPNICHPTQDSKAYMGGDREWDRLNIAKNLDAETSLISCSWGMFQIMGFNFGLAGYSNIGDFVAHMASSERYHISALCNFITNNPPLYRALINRNFQQIALYYNGPNYKINRYDTDLMNIYNTLQRKG